MSESIFGGMQCSLARTLDALGEGWSFLLLRDLYAGLKRFDQLVANLGLSRNLLTAKLRQFEAAGLLERRQYSMRPARYEYELTNAGRELIPAIVALTAWGDKWAAPKEGRPMLFQHESCGLVFVPEVVCSCCKGNIDAENIKLMPGPGGRKLKGTMLIAEMFDTRLEN